MLKWAAGKRLAYRELDDEHLGRVTESTHHEGVAMTVRPLRCMEFQPASVAGKGLLVAMDQVDNPHNIGAIVRTCAFFGVGGVLMGGVPSGSRASSALMRMAEGGAEMLDLYGVASLQAPLTALREKGVPVFGFETDGEDISKQVNLPRTGVLVFGNEQAGISSAVRKLCSRMLAIRGQGGVGSLNVSVTVGIALSQWMRS